MAWKSVEKRREYQREWQRKNRAKTREYRERYIAANREKERARQREVKRIWGIKNPELRKQRQRECYARHREDRIAKMWIDRTTKKARDPIAAREYAYKKHLLEKYKLTMDQYKALCSKQNGLCAACGSPPRDKSGRLQVDHDHETGAIRDLLCRGCNTALGHARDSAEVLRSLIAYLERHGGKWLREAEGSSGSF